MYSLYPLRFEPILRRYLWGGRRLGTELGKPLGEGSDYAESWEIVDHGADQSRVAFGPLAGKTLSELVRERGPELLGRGASGPQFPLLFKFLDAQTNLSVQVHPHDALAAKRVPPDLGKTEAWVILDAAPGSLVYAGLKRGFDRPALAREINRGTTALCLNSFEPKPGDCLFVPAGAVHALGAGLLVAEIQQASDTTYRLFDWNRTGPDGKPRALHIEEGLEATDFNIGPLAPQKPAATARPFVERLVSCDKFVLDRWRFSEPSALEPTDRCHLLAVLSGGVKVSGDPASAPLTRGSTMLVPAAALPATITPLEPSVLLDIYLPGEA